MLKSDWKEVGGKNLIYYALLEEQMPEEFPGSQERITLAIRLAASDYQELAALE